MKTTLLFPPGWSLNVGNPHMALPLLKAALDQQSVESTTRDLNWEVAERYGIRIAQTVALAAAEEATMEAMNTAYFDAEDRLMAIAAGYNGEWNLQLGFSFRDWSFNSSSDVRQALELDSPFTEYFKMSVVPWICHEEPGLIGFNVACSYQIIPALHLTWLLRRCGFSGHIVFGGNTISRLKEEIRKCEWLFDLVDSFVVFQGERPLVQLARVLQTNRDFSSVPNLIWKSDRHIIENPISNPTDPNSNPTPDFEGLPIGQYWGVNYLPLLAARGCYYAKCPFCAIPYGYGNGGFGGIRDAKLVLEDMVSLSEQCGMNRFKFMDEAMPPPLLEQLADQIIRQSVSFQWEGYLRLEKCWLNPTFVRKLGRSGLKKGYFGLEVYSGDTRGQLRKHDNGEEILTILKLANDSGIKVQLFCMFGFPGTGRREAEKTVEFILKNRELIDTVDLNPYVYARHTVIKGISRIAQPDRDWALEYDHEPDAPGVLSSSEVNELTKEMEEIVWQECPRLLHPVYRLVSPWLDVRPVTKDSDVLSVAS